MGFILAVANTAALVTAFVMIGTGLAADNLSTLVLLVGLGAILLALCGARSIYVLARDIDWPWVRKMACGWALAFIVASAIVRMLEQLKVIQ